LGEKEPPAALVAGQPQADSATATDAPEQVAWAWGVPTPQRDRSMQCYDAELHNVADLIPADSRPGSWMLRIYQAVRQTLNICEVQDDARCPRPQAPAAAPSGLLVDL
jgi:hypothetical protein